MTPTIRPRRLRTTPAVRRLVRETRVHPGQLVLPVFVRDGIDEPQAISSLPGWVASRRWALMKVEAAESSSSGWAIWSLSSPPNAMLTLAWPYSTSARPA